MEHQNNDFPDFHEDTEMDYRPHREPSPEENSNMAIYMAILWVVVLLIIIIISINQ